MDHEERLRELLRADPWRMEVLHSVCELELPDCWVAAGFIRNMVWDDLHGIRTPLEDVDVIFFDSGDITPERDRNIEERLGEVMPDVNWSVKNQARMHQRNGHAPYQDSGDAMSFWPETATSVAVRQRADEQVEVLAPRGLDDLYGLVVEKNPKASQAVYSERLKTKRWQERWPLLRVE